MRNLILKKIEKLKSTENGFKNEKWNDFYVGAYHLSEFYPEGIPTEEMLFDFYDEVMKWHYTKQYMG